MLMIHKLKDYLKRKAGPAALGAAYTALATDAYGNQLYPGPGDNGYITRPPSCEQATTLVNATAPNCVPGANSVDPGVGCAQAIIHGWLTGGKPSCDC